MGIDWHFIDYPDEDEVVICKPCEYPVQPLFMAVWDSRDRRWLDVGRDYSWFGAGVACWGYVRGIPETTKQMPLPR